MARIRDVCSLHSIYHREKTKNARARDVEECVGVGRARARRRRASPSSASSSAKIASPVRSNRTTRPLSRYGFEGRTPRQRSSPWQTVTSRFRLPSRVAAVAVEVMGFSPPCGAIARDRRRTLPRVIARVDGEDAATRVDGQGRHRLGARAVRARARGARGRRARRRRRRATTEGSRRRRRRRRAEARARRGRRERTSEGRVDARNARGRRCAREEGRSRRGRRRDDARSRRRRGANGKANATTTARTVMGTSTETRKRTSTRPRIS